MMESVLDGVRVLDTDKAKREAKRLATCGTCGRSWDDGEVTATTPTPSGRCPFEYYHGDEYHDKKDEFVSAYNAWDLARATVAEAARPFVVDVVKRRFPEAVRVHTISEESPFIDSIEMKDGTRFTARGIEKDGQVLEENEANLDVIDELHDTDFFWSALSFVQLDDEDRYGKGVIEL